MGTVRVFLEADAPRVACSEHGAVVAKVPWARHGAGFTTAFEEQAAWLATHTSKQAVTCLLRVAWRTVGAMTARVFDERGAQVDPLAGLRRIGIDEIMSKGQSYLGDERAAKLRLVSADAGSWITNVVDRRAPNAVRCIDPFNVVAWATDALDEVRRQTWNDARRAGQTTVARELKSRPLRAVEEPLRPHRPPGRQARRHRRDQPAPLPPYLLKEQLRLVFHQPTPEDAIALLDRWLAWACRSKIPAFVKLARTVRARKTRIYAAVAHDLSNARIESVNTRIRLLTRVAFGFHCPQPLIALAMLTLGGLCPPLPGRAPT